MWLVNWIKVIGIWVCDVVNCVRSPFVENVDMPVMSPLLSYTEELFYNHIQQYFMRGTGEFLYEKPRPESAGDTTLWHGIYTGMAIMRGDEVTPEYNFLATLFDSNGRLGRGFIYDQDYYGTLNLTTSNDSATGVLWAFYCAYRWGTSTDRARFGRLLLTWVKSLKANGWALVNDKDEPTKYGKFVNGALTDPLRLTLLLAVLRLAACYDAIYLTDYLELYHKYRPILPYPKVSLLWWDTSYDTHRAAINLHILFNLTSDRRYLKGLERLYRISKKQCNPWVNALCGRGRIADILKSFDVQTRLKGDVITFNSDWPTVKWGKKVRALKALPIYRRGSQDFFWQRHPFLINDWPLNDVPGAYHTGLDFLVCYWLAKRTGQL